jgi:predicted ATPase/serine phosphatase RsbU (regulator of sigma subunit)/tRNA A-37 threonylcarbamoyl transferase component Bud32
MINIPHYQISQLIYESANSVVYQGIRIKDKRPVILKMLKQDYPTSAELTRYQQEYEMIHDFNIAGVIKAYGIEKYHNTLVIILEDFGGLSLKQFLANQTIHFNTFLSIAIQIADSLANIHAANIIHKDINPSNIVWEPVSQQLKIIDFGIASRLPRENPTLTNPEQLEGTLAYLSPEQTGRINRSIDYRTDLYSLGVTFYELLTGVVPFRVNNAMELVHCHIAKTPEPICEINPDVPPILADLIMKLMAKNAEDRYQSAFGVKADLQKCLKNINTFQSLKAFRFKLAQNDFSGQFQIPQKLYGRENEVNILLQTFERVSSGKAEIMFVAGYSGVGKTALVHEVHKPMTEKHGHFAAGKFDQYQRNIPYSAFTQAFNGFCDYLLTESSEQLKQWREKILHAVGPNGQVLIDIIPQLELVIGPQSPVLQVGPQEAQNRFHLVFEQFFHAICQKEHPLVLFIDDWQWADSASLNLLKTVMTDLESQYFMIIAAYRDNEVESHHPLMITLEELQKSGALVKFLSLSNLSIEDINTLIADSLKSEASYVRQLTKLVYKKTQGNAFFTHEFLKSLYQESLLLFDSTRQQWEWDINKIAAKGMTDNLVELMANKIEQLPSDCIEMLKLASCIGNTFDLQTLSTIAQQPLSESLCFLWKAIEEGLILPLDQHYKRLKIRESDENKIRFQFQHDRVQQAAYFFIADGDKGIIHLQIGRLLLAKTTDWEDQLFDIVNQLNQAISLISDKSEQIKLAELNWQAGTKAKAATAYQPALNYLQTGIDLLGNTGWQDNYTLCLALHHEAVETAYLSGQVEIREAFSERVKAQGQSILDKIKVYDIQTQAYTTQNQMQEAINIGLEALEMLGISLSDSPPSHLIIEELEHLPRLSDPEKLAAMRILMALFAPVYLAKPTMLPLIAFTMVDICLKEGNSPLSAFAYGFYGTLLCGPFSDIESGYQLGELALKMLDQFEAKEIACKVINLFYTTQKHWKVHARHSIQPLREGIQIGLETGDIEYTCYISVHYSSLCFFVGETLESVEQAWQEAISLSEKLNQTFQCAYAKIWGQLILNLMGLTSDRKQLIGELFNEKEMLPILHETKTFPLLFSAYFAKMMLCYLYKDYSGAVDNASKLSDYEQSMAGLPPFIQTYFYSSLAYLASYPSVSKSEQILYLEKVVANQEKMRLWAQHAPMNVQHKFDLLEAEKARLLGEELKAIDLYEKAIAGAQKNDYLQEEALAYELAAEFYLGRGMEICAQSYMREAYYRYQKWGALAKLTDLETQYPQLLSTQGIFKSNMSDMDTVMSQGATHVQTSTLVLDFDTVTKAAQTLAGEIVLSRLLEKMMHIVIENAGAERGVLIIEKEKGQSNWVIEAEGAINLNEISILQSICLENHVSTAIVNYVTMSHKAVVLSNAMEEALYKEDSYIQAHQLLSVLCTPILHQGQLIGLLYLENNLIQGAFTPARLNIVDMLSSQAAISLENALLYRTLEQKVEQRTKQLAEANQEITALNERLKEDNLRMSAELDIAKQLQQMVLPKEFELQKIEGLDIAGFMEPADEVGGDYYEILNHNGHIKIGIGDVTGHGLESGVIMLMVQTTVRALLLAGFSNPEAFLNVVNRTIYHNAQRMGTDKNLTLSLLDYHAGQLRVTGQHEEVLVVREGGKIERVDTVDLGFMVGVIPNIAHTLSHLDIALQPGDGIVLYTDGITEARDMEMTLYGEERLCAVVSQHWHLTAQEIQEAVVDDVKQYMGRQKMFDDITLLVLKQL